MYSNKKERKKFGAPKNQPKQSEDETAKLAKEEDKTEDLKVAKADISTEKKTSKHDSKPKSDIVKEIPVKEKKQLVNGKKEIPIKGKKETHMKEKKETPVKGEKQEVNPKTEGKRARLIVRNLAFKCSQEELTEAFKVHGEVKDVHIPRKKNKSRLGFAFIQMSNKAQAGMAIKALNGKQLKGRMVAVDWALPKDKFESKQESKAESSDSEEDMEVEAADSDTNDASGDSAEEDGDEKSEGSDDDDDDADSDDEDESEDEDEDGSESEEEDDSEDDESEKSPQSKPKIDRPSDVEEGRTVFVRNLPFSVDEESVVEFFSEFGDVKYAKLVIDKASGMPRGSAFVQFKATECTDKCLQACAGEDGSGLSMGGRDLYVSLAVSRQKASEIVHKKDEKKEKKDSRNLYLAREGMIRSGTEAAKDVPESDLLLRTKIDAAKRRKLKDQNVFVSSVRLCVHNIPVTITDKQLRKVCAKATGEKTAKITECRIMRDLARPNAEGVGKSRGYAFCSFSKHEHALAALRWMNNNPDAFGDKKRPIVEFSLENRKALEAKEKRLEKAKARQSYNLKMNPPNDAKTNKKKRKSKPLQGGEAKPLAVRKQQDVVARSLHKGKPLGLPSHSGPKQRHKPRPVQQWQMDNKKNAKSEQKKNSLKKQKEERRSQAKIQQPLKKPGKRKLDTDSFDRLVASYKQKIMKSTQNVHL